MCGHGQLVTMMGYVKSPYVGLRFLEEPPCMTRVLPGPVRGVVGHYIDRCISLVKVTGTCTHTLFSTFLLISWTQGVVTYIPAVLTPATGIKI